MVTPTGATHDRGHAPRPTQHPSSRFRPDLEGLRAVAVLLVILDHLFHWPLGGFIGVDVFFVLSGFLITGLLLSEYRNTGSISFKRFYTRRVKRILPASTLVIAVTAVGVYAVFLGARVQQALFDGIWALFFTANWRFVILGQDYFAQDRSASPYQHYWSLAVEEQFYFIWPIVLFLALVLAGRSRRKDRSVLTVGVTLTILTASSFAWAMVETVNNPLAAYFSTFSRAWELGAGGLLALLVANRRVKIPTPLALSTLGITIVIASAMVLNPGWPFPGPWALVPVLGTLLIITAGCGQTRHNPLLSNPVSRYIGRISFSLYLWHWPVIVIFGGLWEGRTFHVAALVATALLSMASYHFVEEPIRTSSWLTADRAKRTPAARDRLALRWQAAGMTILLVVTAFTAHWALVRTPPPVAAQQNETTISMPTVDNETAPVSIETMIQIAVESRSWPSFTLDLDELEDSKVAEWTRDQCIDVGKADIPRCTYDSGPRLAVVVGDSVAVSWLPTVRGALSDHGYATLSLTMGQCPAAYTDVQSNNGREGFAQSCTDYQEFTRSQLNLLDPDLVLVSSAENSLRRLSTGADPREAGEEWLQATRDLVSALVQDGHQVIVLSPPPEGRNLQGCITRFNSPSDCLSAVGDLWETQSRAEAAAVAEVDSSQVQYVDTLHWFCNSMRQCPSFVGTTPIRADGNHLTGAYAGFLGPFLEAELRQSGVLEIDRDES